MAGWKSTVSLANCIGESVSRRLVSYSLANSDSYLTLIIETFMSDEKQKVRDKDELNDANY